jgi:hypothetical protein
VSDEVKIDLGSVPLDELKAERVRKLAQLVLDEERRLMERPVYRNALRGWRVVEPVLLAAACVVYLTWAVSFAARLYQ